MPDAIVDGTGNDLVGLKFLAWPHRLIAPFKEFYVALDPTLVGMVVGNQRLVDSKFIVIQFLIGVWELSGLFKVFLISLVLKRAFYYYLKQIIIRAVIVLLEHRYPVSVLFWTATLPHLHLAFLLSSINLLFITFPNHHILAFDAAQRIQSLLPLRGRGLKLLHLLIVIYEVSHGTSLLLYHARRGSTRWTLDKLVISCLHKLYGLGAFYKFISLIHLAAFNNSAWRIREFKRPRIENKLVLNCSCEA